MGPAVGIIAVSPSDCPLTDSRLLIFLIWVNEYSLREISFSIPFLLFFPMVNNYYIKEHFSLNSRHHFGKDTLYMEASRKLQKSSFFVKLAERYEGTPSHPR